MTDSFIYDHLSKFTGYGNLLIKIPSAKIAAVSPARRRDLLTLI